MIRLRTTLLIPALALLITACASKPEPATVQAPPASPEKPEKPAYKKPVRMHGRGAVTSISLEQFFTLHQSDKVMVFDARPAFFYKLGHIPGAINLPAKNCDESIHNREAEIKAALAAGKTLVTYCTGITCPDARTVATHLSGFGHPASVFSGGWHEWNDAGMPTE